MLDISININETLIILFRIGLAVVLAFIPGIERELTGKFAGLRTHILVCLGACVFTILSVYGFEMRSSQEYVELNGLSRPFIQNDPARIAAHIHKVAAVVIPKTLLPWRITVQAPIKPIPVITCAAIRAGSF